MDRIGIVVAAAIVIGAGSAGGWGALWLFGPGWFWPGAAAGLLVWLVAGLVIDPDA